MVVAIRHVTQLRTLATLHCSISAHADARNLHVLGLSGSRSERSVSTGSGSGKNPPGGGKNPPPVLRTTAVRRQHPGGGRASLPGRQTVTDVGTNSATRWYFLLGFFPAPGTSHFYTFTVDAAAASDWLSMECNEPMSIDTESHNCTVVLPQGAVAYCGTTAGALVRWNIRYQRRFSTE